MDSSFTRLLKIDTLGTMYLATEKNLFVSWDNGVNWKKTFSVPWGMNWPLISSLSVDKIKHVYLGLSSGGVYRSLDTGKTWKNILAKDEWMHDIFIDSDGTVFACSYNPSIIALPENDSIWQNRSSGLTNDVIWKLFTNQKGDMFAGTGCGLYLSTNKGGNWSRLYDNECDDFIAFASIQGGTIYMGGADRGTGLYKSTDDGLNWKRIANIEVRNDGITITSEGKIFLSASGSSSGAGLFYATTKNDTVWQKVIGTYGAVFAIHPNGYLYTGAGLGRIYKSTERVDVDRQILYPPPPPPVIIVYDFSLLQNFPNPANSMTKIRYSISTESFVLLEIFNVLGQKVVTLVNESRQPGNYVTSLNTEILPSGIYIYKLSAGNYSAAKKMIILR
ncbi:MAG: T9SS type A sorting domain-containing protein [Ignavibacteriales bacterium]|nr:T9SS type A sorting domain-containing protein [Ignavibacteriales bacterium]